MGQRGFKDSLVAYSESFDDEVQEDMDRVKKIEKKKGGLPFPEVEILLVEPGPKKENKEEPQEKLEKASPLPKPAPPAPPVPQTPPPPETPDALEVDVDQMEDPFGPSCQICLSKMQMGMLEMICGHHFHRKCLQPWVDGIPKNGQRFLTSRARCPCCRQWIVSKSDRKNNINDLVKPIVEQWNKMCDLMLANNDIDEKHREAIKGMKEAKKELPFMKEYVFYLCFDCGDIYFGGLRECEQNHGEDDEEKDRKDHICVKCVNKKLHTNYPTKCEKHGEAFIVFKCRFCCNVSNWFCFGTTHFCERCHKLHNNGFSGEKRKIFPCPGPPECGPHAKNGKEKENEQCLGCALCRKV